MAAADTDQDGKIRVENFEHFLQEQVFILNTHLESQGEQACFIMENLMAQVSHAAGPVPAATGTARTGGVSGRIPTYMKSSC